MRFVDNAHDVVADDLEQQFVPLRDRRLAADDVSKFALHRRERGFDIRPPMVVRQELVPVQRALMDAAARDGLELSAWLRQLALRAAGALPRKRCSGCSS